MKDEDFGYKRIVKELEELGKLKLIIYIDDKKSYEKTGASVDYIAMIMEYGSEEFNVSFPARPFFRPTFDAHYEHFAKKIEIGIGNIISGNSTARKVLQDVGRYAVKKVRETINNGKFPELDEKTIKRKKSKKPLIDTKLLYRSVKYKIERSE